MKKHMASRGTNKKRCTSNSKKNAKAQISKNAKTKISKKSTSQKSEHRQKGTGNRQKFPLNRSFLFLIIKHSILLLKFFIYSE
jgi:hypothetical protein